MGKKVRHFVGVESSEQLAFIDELQALGLSNTIKLPELVVVGDQNTGKSSVLQAITEVSFPVKDTMCTRFPIQISFRQTSAAKKLPVKATLVPGPRSEEDEELLARVQGFAIEKEELTAEIMEEIIVKATECIFGDKRPLEQLTLSDATLRIERSGPDEMHWTIVDLPGMIRHTKSGKGGETSNDAGNTVNEESRARTNAAVAEELARTYLNNERNIILVVVDNVDVERHKTFELIEEIPSLQTRCIGVLTKCDRKQEGSDHWMLKLLQNDLTTVPHLDHGWFGLRNRLPTIERHLSDVERDNMELKEFSKPVWEGLSKDRTGIRSLMNYIDKERRAQIQKEIPHIIAEITQHLRECEATLKRMGESRTTPRAQRYYVLQFCNEMQKMAEGILRGQPQDVPSGDPNAMLRYKIRLRLDRFSHDICTSDKIAIGFTDYRADLEWLRTQSSDPKVWQELVVKGDGLYAAISQEAKICEGTSLPGSVHPDVEEKLFRRLSAHWEGIAQEFVEDIRVMVKDCYDILLRIAIPNSKVRLEVSHIVGKTLEEWNKDADMALRELVDDNQTRPLITRNPLLQSFTNLTDEILLEKKTNSGHPSHKAAKNEVNGASSKEDGGPYYLPTSLNQILSARARIDGYYNIALWRFIDNVVMQVIERHVLGPKCPMRVVSADRFAQLDDTELNAVAGEDESDTRMRIRLERTQSRYRKALEQWERLRVL
ncbi:P-loop containing nucleoside triphosphate hydrolase protein [Aspergillus bertholletiae]|uniref:P-loop containing nucleoside triphosphate hydrolase protein n=1 Tax=Aspergillus bertholletiae TaxID=1226010 RepID=A0A5N7BJ24_9EURO|nr:P-loop containing nucleoside triphosphate hydrolase protein [Aspergillus bertholletiae]